MSKRKGTPPPSSISQNVLVRRLMALGLAASPSSKPVFTDRLAELIDIADAVALSDFFATLNRVAASGERQDPRGISDFFEQSRAAISRFIDDSFPKGDNPPAELARQSFRLPAAASETVDSPDAAGRYARFYSLHQSELERRVAQLRQYLLERLRAESDSLAQVAAVEDAMHPMLLRLSRSGLASLPKLVAQRFEDLRTQYTIADGAKVQLAATPSGDNWLASFHDELQQLLHAELSLRLQPSKALLSCLMTEDPERENS